MKKILFSLMCLLFFSTSLFSQETVTIGTGTSSTYGPLSGWYGYERNIMLYRADELSTQGNIQSIAFQGPASSYSDIPTLIYFKEVAWENIPATSELIWNELIADATLVYQGMPAITSGSGWFTISTTALETFTYTGGGNLLVLIATNKTGGGGSSISWKYGLVGNASNVIHTSYKQDSNSPNDNISLLASYNSTVGTRSITGIGTSDAFLPNVRWNTQFVIESVNITCPMVTNLVASSVTHNNATITWTAGGTESQWLVSYKKATETNWSNDIPVSSPTYSFATTPLSSNTEYNISVKALCGAGDTSYQKRVNFTTLISCPAPSNLAAIGASISEDEATLNWHSPTSPSATGYEDYTLEYKLDGTEWSTATVVENITDTFYTIINLQPSSLYNARVKINCIDDANGSVWIETNFRTNCGTITTFPWTENFDTYGSSAFPPCMFKPLTYGNYPWTVSTNASPPYSLFFCSNYQTIAVTPRFSADATTLMVTFKLRREGGSSGTFQVGVMSDPTDATTFTPVHTYDQTTYYEWQEFELYLSSADVNDAHYVAFKQIALANNYYYWLDDVVVDLIPTCPRPEAIVVAPLGFSATATWATVASESQWLVSYKESSATTWSTEEMVEEPTYTMNSLTEVTSYDVRVRAFCGVGDTSNYRTVSFTTAMDPSPLPFTEDFENPSTWELLNGSQTNKWVISNATAANDNGGTQCLYISNSSSAPYAYSYSIYSETHAFAIKYLNFELPGEYQINYDWKNYAEEYEDYDYIRVYLAPVTATVSAGSSPNTTGWIKLHEETSLQYQSSWQNVDFTFSVTTPSVYKLIFCWYSDYEYGIQPPGAIDNIWLGRLSCSRPGDLVVSEITSSSANVTWSEMGTATQWLLSYKKSSETAWSNEIPISTDPEYSFSVLQASSSYDVRVRSLCGVGDTSSYTSITFQTACGNISIPHYDNFDHYATGESVMPTCWTRTTTYTNRPYVSSGGVTGNCLYFYAGNTGTYNIAALPPIDPAIPINTLMVTFLSKAYSTDSLQIGVMTDPEDASTFELVQSVFNTSTYAEFEVALNTYSGTGRYIAFRIAYDDNSSYAYVDDLEINVIASCLRPVAITVNPLATSATATWTPAATETQWLASYKESAASTWSAEQMVNVPSYTMSSLTEVTNYDVRIRAFCGAGDTSNYRMATFSTIMEPMPIPFTEDFENPTPWHLLNGTQTNQWVINTAAGSNGSGTQSLYISNNATASPPPYNYNNGSASSVYAVKYLTFEAGDHLISYDWKANGESGWDYLQVWLAPITATPSAGSSPTTTGWINLYGSSNLCLQSSWQSVENREFAVTTPGVYKLIFYWRNDGSGGYPPPGAIDNIHIEKISCSAPVNLEASSITVSSALITWTEPGEATQWLLSYKKSSETAWGNEITITTTPEYDIDDLESSSGYNVRVRSLCGGGDTSNYRIITFQTECGDITNFPWTENFDDYGEYAFPPCWTRPIVYSGYPQTVITHFSAPYSLRFMSNYITYAVTPRFTQDVNTLMVTFKLRQEDPTYSGDFQVGVMTDPADPSTFTLVETIINSDEDIWEEFEVRLDAITVTGAHYIAFKQDAYYNNYYYWLDDVEVEPIPTCPRVSAITFTETNPTTFNVTWTAGGSETQWLLSHKKASETTWSDEITVNNTPAYLLGGLDIETNYNVRIRALCTVGDTSLYRTETFRSGCGEITTLPWRENFDSYAVNTFPPCMTKPLSYNSYPWTVADVYSSSPNSLYFQSNLQTIAVTPRFVQETTNMIVKFKLRREGSSSGTFQVGVLSDPNNATTFVPVETFNQSTYETWEEFEVPLYVEGATGMHYIGFKQNAAVSYYYYWLDDIEVYSAGDPCPSVTNFNVTVQGGTAILTWGDPEGGAPLSYKIYRDGVEEDVVPYGTNEYTLEYLENGSHTAAVAAVYAEEFDCIPQLVTVPFTVSTCSKPVDVRAAYSSRELCHVILSWLPPDSKTPETYRIYRDGILIDSNITVTEYTDTELDAHSSHIWGVQYMCSGSGSSDIEYSNELEKCRDNVEDFYFSQLVLSPNPANSFVTISGAVISKVEIYNAMGQMISSQIENVTTVDVSSYSDGVYFFKLYNANNESTVKRVVIAK